MTPDPVNDDNCIGSGAIIEMVLDWGVEFRNPAPLPFPFGGTVALSGCPAGLSTPDDRTAKPLGSSPGKPCAPGPVLLRAFRC